MNWSDFSIPFKLSLKDTSHSNIALLFLQICKNKDNLDSQHSPLRPPFIQSLRQHFPFYLFIGFKIYKIIKKGESFELCIGM